MVKNSGINQPTDMVRLGRLTDSDQPKNSIVFNASDKRIRDIKHSGLYISPIRNASASNLLAYDSITNEVVDIGGTQLKLDDLQVKNLEVVNMKTLNEEHVYTPVLQIGEGCSNKDNVGLDIHGMKIMNDKYSGKLFVSENTKIDGTIEATQFIGDGGLLSNVQYDLNIDIGDVVENLHVVGELKADGSFLSNITVSQITDFDGYSPKFTEVHTTKDISGRSLYANKRIHAKGNINSDGNVFATAFYGDGTQLTGVSMITDLEKSNSRITHLENQIPRFGPLEEIKPKLDNEINKTKTKLDEQIKRFGPLEESSKVLDQRITYIEPKISKLENNIPRIDVCESKILAIEQDIEILPEIHGLRRDIDIINTQVPVIHETKKVVPIVQSNEKRIGEIESKIVKISEIEPIKESLDKFNYVYGELAKIDPIEIRVSGCEESIEKTRDLPDIRTRLTKLENAPLEGDGTLISNIGLTHILSCDNTTHLEIDVQNKITANGFITRGTPKPTCRLGEIKSINMSSLAEINAYTKSNNGTTAGNTGGIVFRTKGKNGKMDPRMTLDGNGKLSVGTHKCHPSAILTLESDTCGFLLPRMSKIDIENPVPGLMVYDTERDGLFVYKKSGWTEIK